MTDFIGSVISLISKSDIRYVGTLVEINSAESTVSLENVKSHGTEGRKKDPGDEVQGSPQIYEFIVFRGSDVKDLVVDEAPAPKEPPQMPNDPAILGARSHPGRAPSGPYNQGPQGPQGPQGAPGFQNQNMYAAYPPQGPPQGWAGRGGPPGPPGPPGAYGMPYPPQGWYPPPGQPGFQNAPPPWAYNPGFAGGQGPPAPPGMQQQPPQQQQQGPGPMNSSIGPQSQNKSAPTGPGAGQNKAVAPVEMSSDSQVLAQQPVNQAAPVAPTPPIASKPSAQEVKQTAQLLENQKPSGSSNAPKQIPTGPRGPTNMASAAAPAPVAVPAAHQTSAEDARQAVVQAAIARLGQTGMGGTVPQAPANGVENLTRKVNEMSMNANRAGFQNLRGQGFNRGRGRGAGGLQGAPNIPQAKIEIPKSDFDFAEANAKFNRDDVIKEKIAGTVAADAPDSTDPQATGETTPAYDKKTSFFDNIGTDRQRKELQFDRTAERGKDIDTFGQASVDGGFRRGRGGRGRGYRGRGRGRGYGGRAYPPRNVAQPGP